MGVTVRDFRKGKIKSNRTPCKWLKKKSTLIPLGIEVLLFILIKILEITRIIIELSLIIWYNNYNSVNFRGEQWK